MEAKGDDITSYNWQIRERQQAEIKNQSSNQADVQEGNEALENILEESQINELALEEVLLRIDNEV